MTCIVQEAALPVPAEIVWAALRDVGNAHLVFRGVLSDCRMDGEHRMVTFQNGRVVLERIIGVDDGRRRIAYTVLLGGLAHHHASMEVLPEPAGCRFVWITDILPDDRAPAFELAMQAGTEALRARFGGTRAQPN